ncbi:DNA internalization-related competence protein ComEC/Rec2 [Chitinispirillum alkaliphilum]|nr:DNA internalization-related competence protein ComEC/Rec2 [Chitinispirillum alkaliphilum]
MNSMKALFPGAVYWSHLPCIIASGAFCFGILTATRLTQFEFSNRLYTHFFILATVSTIISGILTKSSGLRFFLFFVAGLSHYTQTDMRHNFFRRELEHSMRYSSYTEVSGKVRGRITERFGNSYFAFKIENSNDPQLTELLRGKRVRGIYSGEDIKTSGTYIFSGEFSLPGKGEFPFGFNESAYLRNQGLWGNLIIQTVHHSEESEPSFTSGLFQLIRSRSHEIFGSAGDSEVNSIFHAAFLGERDKLTERVRSGFRKAGIFHLLSISGFHAGLLFGAGYAVLALFGLKKKYCMALSTGFLWLYLFFIGFIPSLFRATVMVSCIGGATFSQKKNHTLQALGLAALVWLIWSPYSLFSPGFQLSFAATSGILLLSPILSRILKPEFTNRYINFIGKSILSSFSVSISAFLFTAPVLAYHFGTISLFGILFNIPAIVIMSGAMWSLFAGLLTGMFYVPLATPFVFVSRYMLELLLLLSEFSHFFDYSELTLPAPKWHTIVSFYLFLTGLCAIRKKSVATFFLIGSASLTILFTLLGMIPDRGHGEFVRITRGSSTINGVLWPDNSVWLFGFGEPYELRQMFRTRVRPWFHHRSNPKLSLLIFHEEAEFAAHQIMHTSEQFPHLLTAPAQPNSPVLNENWNYHKINLPLMFCSGKGYSTHISSKDVQFISPSSRLTIPLLYNGNVTFSEDGEKWISIREDTIITLENF